MTEDRIVHLNTVMRDLVFEEYMSVLDTVEISKMKLQTPYIPLVYDLVNVFPDTPWEEAYEILLKICGDNHFFVRGEKDYLFKPILGVW